MFNADSGLVINNNKTHSSISYRPEIDGLRAIAVMSVIFFHAGYTFFSGGYLGVDIFFVISGYLITGIIIKELDNGTFSIKDFYIRRSRRILPALFLTIILSIPLAWLWMTPDQLIDFSESVLYMSIFISNILFWTESGYFLPESELKPLLHTWSLSVEEQFYLIFPLLLLIINKIKIKYLLSTILILITMSSILLSEWASYHYLAANFYLTPTRFWELLIGALVAIYLFKYGFPMTRFNSFASNIGFLSILCSIILFDDTSRSPGIITLIPITGCILLIVFTYSKNTSISKMILSSYPFVTIGLISYSLYLLHQPVFAYARIISLYEPSQSLMSALIIVILFAGYFSWAYVEQPFRNRNNFKNINLMKGFVAITVVFIIFGIAGIQAEGFESRFYHDKNYEEAINIANYFKSEKKEKQEVVRRGKCLDGGESGNKKFIEQWDCWGGENSKIMFMGDSHSADKAAALVLNGINVGWMTGGNCSIVPVNMTVSCREKFLHVLNQINNTNIEYIALSNRFELNELNNKNILSLIKFWSKYNKKLIIFSNMPEFIDYSDVIPKAARLGIRDTNIKEKVSFEVAYKSEEIINDLVKENAGFIFINTRELLCSASNDESCHGIIGNNKYLLLNEDHLSITGLKLFGERLLYKLRANNVY